jgi:hypothetical protein
MNCLEPVLKVDTDDTIYKNVKMGVGNKRTRCLAQSKPYDQKVRELAITKLSMPLKNKRMSAFQMLHFRKHVVHPLVLANGRYFRNTAPAPLPNNRN